MPADLTREEIKRLRRASRIERAHVYIRAGAVTRDRYDALLDMAERSLDEPTRLAAARAEGVREGWNALLREVYALHEDTIEKYHDIGQRDLEGKAGAFARGRCVEAKSIARAVGAIEPAKEDDGNE